MRPRWSLRFKLLHRSQISPGKRHQMTPQLEPSVAVFGLLWPRVRTLSLCLMGPWARRLSRFPAHAELIKASQTLMPTRRKQHLHKMIMEYFSPESSTCLLYSSRTIYGNMISISSQNPLQLQHLQVFTLTYCWTHVSCVFIYILSTVLFFSFSTLWFLLLTTPLHSHCCAEPFILLKTN